LTKEQWQIYLTELYRWAQDKYNALLKGELSEDDYYKVLEFYETETQVISFLIKDELEYLEPEEIEEIINSFENVKNVSSLRELIEKRFINSLRDSSGEESRAQEPPSIHNIPKPPTLSTYAKDIEEERFSNVDELSQANIGSEFDDLDSFGILEEELRPIEKDISTFSSVSNLHKNLEIVLVGERSVGRSTFLNLLGAVGNSFEYEYQGTIYTINFVDHDHETYFPERRELLGFNGVIAFYDITRPDTVFRLEKWLKKVYRDKDFTLPVLFVGNKTDLSRLRIVTVEKAEELVNMVRSFENYSDFLEVSLKLEQNDAALKILSRMINVIQGMPS